MFELLQREAPVFWHREPPPGRGFWCVTKYDDVLAVLRDTATFSSETGGAATIDDQPDDVLEARRNFMETDPPRHTKFRRDLRRRLHAAVPSGATRTGCATSCARCSTGRCRSASSRPCTRLRRRSRSACSPGSSGSTDEHLPRLVELGDRMLVDTEPEYVGELAFRGERPEDRYLPFGSPWAEELCALGRQYYGTRREPPTTTFSR